jgi:hypothetical protein
MIGRPMPIPRPGARPHGYLGILALLLASALAACGPTPTESLPATSSPDASATPVPSPEPTLLFSNTPDPALIALIPTQVAGHAVTVPAITEFGLTPGDIGEAYGSIGARFRTLQLAFVGRPHLLSLYAVRMDPPFATTDELEPYLAAAGEYVGVAGLHREPWTLQAVGGHLVWARPADKAMIAGATVYTWTAEGYLFLMVGVEIDQDLAMISALPGEAPPVPTPSPAGSPDLGSASPTPGG